MSYKVRPCRGMREYARQRVQRGQKVIERGKTDGRLNFSGGQSKGIFFVYVWREWEPLILLTAWIWRGLWPRLVYTVGCFPERAAQGRGTCSSLKHWSRGEPAEAGRGVLPGWKDAWCFQENGHVLDLWNLQVEPSDSQKKTFVLASVPEGWRGGGGWGGGHCLQSQDEIKSFCSTGGLKLWLERVGRCWQLPTQTTQSL